MNQSDIARTKAKPDSLILKPSKPNLAHQNNKMSEKDLSRTLYPLLQRGEKRFISFNEQEDDASSNDRAKKRKIIQSEEISSFSPRLISFPSIDLKCFLKSLHFSLSAAELTKAFNSILI